MDPVSLEFAEGARVTAGLCFTTLGSWSHLQAHWFASGLMVDAGSVPIHGGLSTWCLHVSQNELPHSIVARFQDEASHE